ncbi:phosphotransferase family protein [Nocardioides sp.]|uniref:phosphotransferase family protein n=1 Tax=Nocardioides sp. TaxID=35761 RepID=UPI001A2BD7A2|nr:phosphotransferase family protein [Nocardioides sp.]MBJ7357768.1 phosphotransferase family protein [Nocardioides sp.]
MTDLTPAELDRLTRLLTGAGETVVGPLTATLLTGGRSNLTYRLDDGVSAWALRRPPHGGVIESAHDVVREYRVVDALQGTPVPVARTVVCDPAGEALGAPCAVVAFVPGLTARSRADIDRWSDAEVARCADGLVGALAALHAVDPLTVGLGDYGRHEGYAARQVRRWSGQWTSMDADEPRADRLLAWLAERVPEQSGLAVVHGDYRVDNVLLDRDDPGHVLAIVDWELSTLGDPVADLATMCAYRHSALDLVLGIPAAWTSPRFPSGDDLRHAYAERTGRDLPAFDFYLALAYYKLAVIAQGIAFRHGLGVTVGDGYESVAASVPVLLEAGLDVAVPA